MNRVSAESEHRAALKIAIRNGSFVPLSHARGCRSMSPSEKRSIWVKISTE